MSYRQNVLAGNFLSSRRPLRRVINNLDNHLCGRNL
jgi:hypothetical protein